MTISKRTQIFTWTWLDKANWTLQQWTLKNNVTLHLEQRLGCTENLDKKYSIRAEHRNVAIAWVNY